MLYPTCFLILGCWRTHLHQSLQGWSGGWLGVQWCSWWPGSPIRVILGFNCVDNLAAGGWCIVVITLRPRQNGRHFTECIFLNENYCISIQILRKCVSMGPIITMLALVRHNSRQAIIWINDGQFFRCIYASSGLNVLNLVELGPVITWPSITHYWMLHHWNR